MYPLDMVSHVVHPTEDAITTVPVTPNIRIVLGFVPGKVFLTRESAARGLRAVGVTAEKGLCVSLVVFSKITASREDGF